MPVGEDEATARRRRRTPEAAQREIIDAAEGLLRERPFRELTVDEVMRRTGLSRPSFYVYFKDRHDLILRVVQHLQEEILAVAGRWYESLGGGPKILREALDGVVGVYGAHGPVLRALSDAAVDDRDVEQAYEALVQGFVDVTARHIEAEMQAGHITALDAGETAKALVWMTERYLYHSFGPVRRVPTSRVTETLATLWTRTLYPSS
ncbi:MAG: TetR/AcrR family transcriptional regulator, ethionamide resistance regulator [Solirubrobacteraceae bacterium]|nr:TetR/AcrR family transcriptional regulator, ethionamide resistance regulator [Solirubrobacteraceae bacterium]